MAVAVVLTFPGGTLERYDVAIAKLGFVPGGPGPLHCLFSWVVAAADGLVVTAVWESKREFERFSEHFGAIGASVGILGPPHITFHDVHSYQSAG